MSKNNSKKEKEGIFIQDEDYSQKLDVETTEVNSGDYKNEPVFIYHQWCKKCGLCVEFCPKNVLASKPDGTIYIKHPEKCIHCEMCDKICPDFAITGAKR